MLIGHGWLGQTYSKAKFEGDFADVRQQLQEQTHELAAFRTAVCYSLFLFHPEIVWIRAVSRHLIQ
jgi:hypothetical protein